MSDRPGVSFGEPHQIADSIKSAVSQTLAGVEPGHGTAAIEITLAKGVNVVVAHRFVGGDWNLDGAIWFGKDWQAGMNLGAAVKASW